MTTAQLITLVDNMISHCDEGQVVEYKHNFHSCEEIGQDISALANSASIEKAKYGYIVFGIEDGTKSIVGTTFKSKKAKRGNEELEMWLNKMLTPRIGFTSYDFEYKEGVNIVLFQIPATGNIPVTFNHEAYIRIGSNTTKLREYKEIEAKIWRNNSAISLANSVAKSGLIPSQIIGLLNTQTYFSLMNIPYPNDSFGVIQRLKSENIIVQSEDCYEITKFGALLFANNLDDFEGLSRKAVRVIVYQGRDKIETIREQIGKKGYAVGFEGLFEWVKGQLPANELINNARREDIRMYPDKAIRELLANCIIHQDFDEVGFPCVEIYSDRIEVSNPGRPVIAADRFIDEYQSRNEKLADLMRRMGFCEEKGSGWDKAIFLNKYFQLPAMKVVVNSNRTTVTMFAHRTLSDMSREEKIRACYQHACLKYVSNDKMTNQTLRQRFAIEEHNAATASRIIKDALIEGVIKEDDPDSNSRKYKKYTPYWA